MPDIEALVVDDTRGVIFFAPSDTFTAGPENIWSIPLDAPTGSPAPIVRVSESVLNAALTPAGDPEVSDIALHPDGDILRVNGFDQGLPGDQSLDHIGDILKRSPDMSPSGGDGTATAWVERATLLAPTDSLGTPVPFTALFNPSITTAPNGRILVGSDGTDSQFLVWLSADGLTNRLIGDNTIFRADPDIAAIFATATLDFETRGIAVDGDSDVYMVNQDGLSPSPPTVNAIIKVTGIDYELANADDWMNF